MTRLVEIAHFYDPEEAYCARGFLKSRGIETVFQNEHHLNMAPWMRVALGGYRLLATSEDQNAALEALNSILSTKSEIADSEPDKQWRRKRNWLWLPFAFGSIAPFIPTVRNDWIGMLQVVALVVLYIALFIGWGSWFWYFANGS